jgi:hypothetical protein
VAVGAQANAVAIGAVLLVVLASIRASRKMARDPEAGGSMLGALAWIALFWAGVALASFMFTGPDARVGLFGGVDAQAGADAVGVRSTTLLFRASAAMLLLSLLLSALRHRVRVRRHRATKRDEDDLHTVRASFPGWHGQAESTRSGFEVVHEDERAGDGGPRRP